MLPWRRRGRRCLSIDDVSSAPPMLTPSTVGMAGLCADAATDLPGRRHEMCSPRGELIVHYYLASVKYALHISAKKSATVLRNRGAAERPSWFWMPNQAMERSSGWCAKGTGRRALRWWKCVAPCWGTSICFPAKRSALTTSSFRCWHVTHRRGRPKLPHETALYVHTQALPHALIER